MKTRVEIKRAYDAAGSDDGYRVFVDRLWPRGLSKQTFKFDVWSKDLAPTPGLRTWFGHKVEHWDAFRESYQTELRTPEQSLRMLDLQSAANKQKITLVYAAKDTEHNHAIILAEEMNQLFSHPRKSA